jgi:hypothetical protein
MSRALPLVSLFLLAPQLSPARTWYVKPDDKGDVPRIAVALTRQLPKGTRFYLQMAPSRARATRRLIVSTRLSRLSPRAGTRDFA